METHRGNKSPSLLKGKKRKSKKKTYAEREDFWEKKEKPMNPHWKRGEGLKTRFKSKKEQRRWKKTLEGKKVRPEQETAIHQFPGKKEKFKGAVGPQRQTPVGALPHGGKKYWGSASPIKGGVRLGVPNGTDGKRKTHPPRKKKLPNRSRN